MRVCDNQCPPHHQAVGGLDVFVLVVQRVDGLSSGAAVRADEQLHPGHHGLQDVAQEGEGTGRDDGVLLSREGRVCITLTL